MVMQQTLADHGLDGPVDEVGVTERVARLGARSIKNESKERALRLALSMVDLTTLEGQDTPGKVRHLCRKAITPHAGLDTGPVAAVCVYPSMVPVAVEAVAGSGVKVASVATGFPSGQTPLPQRIDEVRYAVAEGADEIDMVINRGAFLAGRLDVVADEIRAVKEACGAAHLKVILETGELGSLDQVRQASMVAMLSGADFIKTSTGKVAPAATLPVTLVMLQAIRDFERVTGTVVGMKPAGGISDSKTAIKYLVMVNEVLGPRWLTPDLFRFGASRLVDDLLMQLEKMRTGRYQSTDYFSKA
jgi:deoxyribose-phosphate aldolase